MAAVKKYGIEPKFRYSKPTTAQNVNLNEEMQKMLVQETVWSKLLSSVGVQPGEVLKGSIPGGPLVLPLRTMEQTVATHMRPFMGSLPSGHVTPSQAYCPTATFNPANRIYPELDASLEDIQGINASSKEEKDVQVNIPESKPVITAHNLDTTLQNVGPDLELVSRMHSAVLAMSSAQRDVLATFSQEIFTEIFQNAVTDVNARKENGPSQAQKRPHYDSVAGSSPKAKRGKPLSEI